MQRNHLSTKKNDEAIELALLQKLAERLPNDVDILQALAELYAKNKLVEAGLAVDKRLSKLEPRNETVWYNLACSHALMQQIDEAFEALSKAVEFGYRDYEWMKSDTDLDSLREDKRYESLLGYIFSETDAPCEDDEC